MRIKIRMLIRLFISVIRLILMGNTNINKSIGELYIMNKVMILAILVAYKTFNDKSLTIVVNEGDGEYVANNTVIDSIDGDNISFSSWTYSGVYGKTINITDIVGIQFADKAALVGMK